MVVALPVDDEMADPEHAPLLPVLLRITAVATFSVLKVDAGGGSSGQVVPN